MVPQCPPQIQDGGRPSSSKHDKLLYLSYSLTDFDEILHSDILGLQFISAVKIFKFLKTQYSGWPQFDKSSAVAKMGDCGHNIHGPKRGVPLCIFRGSWDPVQYNVAWAKVYFRTKRRLHPNSHLATIDMGQKLGGAWWVDIKHNVT